jgi:hypothetical protein
MKKKVKCVKTQKKLKTSKGSALRGGSGQKKVPAERITDRYNSSFYSWKLGTVPEFAQLVAKPRS